MQWVNYMTADESADKHIYIKSFEKKTPSMTAACYEIGTEWSAQQPGQEGTASYFDPDDGVAQRIARLARRGEERRPGGS